MDEKKYDKIAEFDAAFTSNTLKKLKILYYYLPASSRRGLACYIKLAELQLALDRNRTLLPKGAAAQAEGDFPTICGELLPYCDEEEAASLRQMQSMMQQWENMQEMLQTVQPMQELMPQGDSGEGSPFSSPDNMDLEQMMNLFNMMKSS